MYGSYLSLQSRVYKPMPSKDIFLVEERGDYDGLKRLTATA